MAEIFVFSISFLEILSEYKIFVFFLNEPYLFYLKNYLLETMKIHFVILLLGCLLFAGQTATYAQGKLLSEAELQQAKEYTSLQDALKEPDKVYKLSLSDISTIPADITKLPNLQALFVGNSKIDLQQALTQLQGVKNLQELYIRESQLTTLPSDIGKLQNLRQLDLSFNKFTALPAEIGSLTKLQTLNLMENTFADAEKDKVRKLLPQARILF